MNKHNNDFSLAFSKFEKVDKKLREYALTTCEFKEKKTEHSSGSTFRRPIVCIRTPEQRVKIVNLIDAWKNARDNLHNVEPNRFPLGAAMFNPGPKIISNVDSAQIYINTATNSRILSSQIILGRLSRMRRALVLKRDKSMYEFTIETIDKEIEYFKSNEDTDFRLRSTGYTEIILNLYANGDEIKYKIGDIGVFIENKKNMNFVLSLPEQANSVATRKQRRSIYEDLDPIVTVLPFTGQLFKETDVIKAKAAELKQRKSNSLSKYRKLRSNI